MKMIFSRFLAGITLLLLMGCSALPAADPPPPSPTPSRTPLPPTLTPTATSTLTSTPTLTPSPTPTPTWAFHAAGEEVICPILLYHRIGDTASRYFVPPADFQAQMEALQAWGYTPIPISLLVQAITEGASLPPRPIVISFDDGWESVYTGAFPIMRALGFPGVLYLVSDYLDAKDYLSTEQVLEMAAAGWEVGSHSKTHLNLLENPAETWTQAALSRKDLKAALGFPVDTFAYPYGKADDFVMEKVRSYGYKAAVGLGGTHTQGLNNLFYLGRTEVQYGVTLEGFAALLPWADSVP